MDAKNSKNRRTKSIIIDKNEYKSLLTMLTSGHEDITLALEFIKNMDPKANILPILLLRKNSACDFSEWTKRCKKHIAYQYSLGIDNDIKNVIYTDIYHEIIKKKESNVSKEHIEIFSEEIGEFLRKHLIKYDFVEDVELKIKLK
jgi:hypothetical protein